MDFRRKSQYITKVEIYGNRFQKNKLWLHYYFLWGKVEKYIIIIRLKAVRKIVNCLVYRIWGNSLFQFSTDDEAKSPANLTLRSEPVIQLKKKILNNFFYSNVGNFGSTDIIRHLLKSSRVEKNTYLFLGGGERKPNTGIGRVLN